MPEVYHAVLAVKVVRGCVSTLTAPLGVMKPRHTSFPQPTYAWVFVVLVSRHHRQHGHGPRETKMEKINTTIGFIHPFSFLNMLWKYSLNFTGFIEAATDITDARRRLMDKMKTDPASFISKLEPAESPSLWKMVVGMQPAPKS